MSAEPPTFTQRELAQSFLTRYADEILQVTGRNTGFPSSGTPSQQPLGPPPVIITRVVDDDRTKNGISANPTEPNDGYGVDNLVNSFTPATNIEFLDLPTNIIDSLAPSVNLYKLYPFPGEPEKAPYPIKFEPDLLSPDISVLNDSALMTEWLEEASRAPRVGITALTVKRLGGNPAEIESNIEVSITINAEDLNNFFYRYRPKELPLALGGAAALEFPPKVEEDGVAWIDLINMGEPEPTGNNCQRTYDPDAARIMLEIGWYIDPTPEAQAEASYAAQGEKRSEDACKQQQLIDQQPDRFQALTEAQLSEISRKCVAGEPLVDGINGIINPPPASLEPDEEKDYINIAKMHKEILYLSLKNHEITLGPELSVDIKINFIGYGEAQQREARADILGDPRITAALERVQRAIDNANNQLGQLQPVAPPDNCAEIARLHAEDPVANPENCVEQAYVEQNMHRETCRNDLESELAVFKEDYQLIQNVSKGNLYRQLRLAMEPRSRIYTAKFPEIHTSERAFYIMEKWTTQGALGITATAEDLAVRRAGSAAGSGEATIQIANYADVERDPTWGGDFGGAANRQSELTNMQQNYSADMNTESRQQSLSALARHEGGVPTLQFVFLGDVLEAALEIVASNTELAKGTASQERAEQWNDRHSGAIQRSVLPFFMESSNGEMGPMTKRTLDIYGKYIFGDVALPKMSDDEVTKTINIADLPIDLEFVRTVWFNEVISKPQVKRYYIRNLISAFINKLVPYAIANRFNENSESVSTENPQAMANYFSLPGEATDLSVSTGGTYARTAAISAADAAYQALGIPSAPDELYSGEVQHGTYMTMGTVQEKVESMHAAQESAEKKTAFNVFIISQQPSSRLKRNGNEEEDKRHGIKHYRLNRKKVLRGIQFSRIDLPALQVANLITDQGTNKLGILREKYDATVLLKGNVVYKPGSVLYIEPEGLAGPLQPPSAPGRVMPTRLEGILPARALGLGGYFVVISVSHDWGSIAEGGEWLTELNTRWLSFKHDDLGATCDTQTVDPNSTDRNCLREQNQAGVDQEITNYRRGRTE